MLLLVVPAKRPLACCHFIKITSASRHLLLYLAYVPKSLNFIEVFICRKQWKMMLWTKWYRLIWYTLHQARTRRNINEFIPLKLPKLDLTTDAEPGIERVQALADISRSALYALVCFQQRNPCGVRRLSILPIVHNKRAPLPFRPSYIRVRAAVWESGEGQTDRRIHRRPWPIHISLRVCLTRNIIMLLI